MAEDALDHVALVDQRNDTHLFLAFRAQEQIGVPDFLDEFAISVTGCGPACRAARGTPVGHAAVLQEGG